MRRIKIATGRSPGAGLMLRLSVKAKIIIAKIAVARNSAKKEEAAFMYGSYSKKMVSGLISKSKM